MAEKKKGHVFVKISCQKKESRNKIGQAFTTIFVKLLFSDHCDKVCCVNPSTGKKSHQKTKI